MASDSALLFSAMIIGSPILARMEATRPSSGSFQPLMSISTTSGRIRSRRSRKLLTSPMSWCSTMMRNGRSARHACACSTELAVFDGQSDGQWVHCASSVLNLKAGCPREALGVALGLNPGASPSATPSASGGSRP